jgi:hypothetical protein
LAINFRPVEGLTPERYDRTYPGVVVRAGTGSSELRVNVMGNIIAARWSDPVIVAEGDTVLVQFVMSKNGLSEAYVRARVAARPRPYWGTVTVVPPGSSTVTVTGSDGYTYTADFTAHYTPVVGERVMLAWNASQATITGKFGSAPAPPPPQPAYVPPPPPPPVTTGVNTYWASSSNTFWGPGGWGSWAGGRGRVYQGNYGSGDVYGAWFYGGGPTQLQGRTIDRMRFVLGGRIAAGNFNSPVTVRFYAHNSTNQPGGIITGVAGPIDVTAWPGQGLTDYDLTPLAPHVLAGGGIAIYNAPYAGFYGRNEQPDSGKLVFDWRS